MALGRRDKQVRRLTRLMELAHLQNVRTLQDNLAAQNELRAQISAINDDKHRGFDSFETAARDLWSAYRQQEIAHLHRAYAKGRQQTEKSQSEAKISLARQNVLKQWLRNHKS